MVGIPRTGKDFKDFLRKPFCFIAEETEAQRTWLFQGIFMVAGVEVA